MLAGLRKSKKWYSLALAASVLAAAVLPNGAIPKAEASAADHVVISAIYGAGGNAGALLSNDYVELYNPKSTAVDMSGWSVQYTAKAGTSKPTAANTVIFPDNTSIGAHKYFLVKGSKGTAQGTFASLPASDAGSDSSLSMSGTDGVVFLSSASAQIDPAVLATDTSIVDYVGYGAASLKEGSAAAPATSITTAIVRRTNSGNDPITNSGDGNGSDTNDNASDFVASATTMPTIHNSSSPAEPELTEGGDPAPIKSTNVIGSSIQFDNGQLTGLANAAVAGADIAIYNTAGGTKLTDAVSTDGTFAIPFNSASLTSVYVTATESGKVESDPVRIDLAVASNPVVTANATYVVDDSGHGTLTGNAGAASANAQIGFYQDAAKTQLLGNATATGTGAFTYSIASAAPDTVYVAQRTSSANGRMLEGPAAPVTKVDTGIAASISSVRAVDGNGVPTQLNQIVTIEGVVTFENGKLGTQKSNFYIQDGTGGVNIFSSTFDPGTTIARGDKIKVIGKVLNYSGLIEVEPTSITRTDTGLPVPDAKAVTIADMSSFATAEPNDGLLATLTGKVSNIPATTGNQNITIVDQDNHTFILRVLSGTGINLATDLELNKTYSFTGVLGQYDNSGPATTGYELFPRDKNDITPQLALDHTQMDTAYKNTNVTFSATASGASSVKLYYKSATDADFTSVDMATSDQSLYSVTLPAASVPADGFDYKITAEQGAQVITKGPYHVNVIEDTVAPSFYSEEPEMNSKMETTQPTISISVDDPSGIDASSIVMKLNGTPVPATLVGSTISYKPAEALSLGDYTVSVTAADNSEHKNSGSFEWPFQVVERFTGGNHYYGTTHNHTNISHDAAGNPEDALKAAEFYGYDWFAFSDHSHDIDADKRGTDTVMHNGMPERTGGTDWQLTKDLATEYTKNGSFVVFPAFEMTSTTWGHSNVFGTTNFIDRVQDGGTYQNLKNYYAWVMTYDNIVAQFNHPNMSANAFDNFIPYDKNVDKLFAMLEVGNGSGKYSYVNAEDKFFSALDLGWHIAPTYGEDNHDASWGQTKDRTVIVADSLSQESLLDAMRKMHVYMTEDPNAKLDVSASGWYMGSTTDTKNLEFDISGSDSVLEKASDPKYSYIKTTSNDNIAKAELITNGGTVLDTYVPDKDSTSFNWKPQFTVAGGQQWFVVRVTQKDGDRIYSSPIWSPEEAVSVKVNNVAAVDGAIIGGLDATLSAGVTNLGTSDVTNITAHFYYDQADDSHLIGSASIASLKASLSTNINVTWAKPEAGEHKVIVVLDSTDADLGTNKFEQNFTIKAPLGKTILIDASKKNENTTKDTGSYPDNLKLFTVMMKQQGYTVQENTAPLTSSVLSSASVLFITHPASTYSADEITAIHDFVAAGGSLFLAERANTSGSNQDTNAILSGVGSSILVNNDSIYDETDYGNFFGDHLKTNYAVRAHPTPVGNLLTDFVPTIESYSGSSLAKNDGTGKKVALTDSDAVSILVRGNESTFQNSPTVKDDTAVYNQQTSNSPAGPALTDVTGGSAIPMLASETIGSNGGRIIVSGMNIFHDKEMDQSFNPKGNDPFAINAMNWLSHLEPKVVSIADARKLPEGTPIVVEGKVTTAAGNFYDSAYVQDATGGIMAFSEVPEGSLKLGDTVRVYGHISIFENNVELEFDKFDNSVVKVGSGTPIEPKTVSTKDAVSDAYQGQLVKVTGTVKSIPDNSSYIINDGSGDVLVFVDGFIVNQTGPLPDLKVGDTLEAVGLSGKYSLGDRIRVRDTKELKVTAGTGSDPGTGTGTDPGTGTGTDPGTGTGTDPGTGTGTDPGTGAGTDPGTGTGTDPGTGTGIDPGTGTGTDPGTGTGTDPGTGTGTDPGTGTGTDPGTGTGTNPGTGTGTNPGTGSSPSVPNEPSAPSGTGVLTVTPGMLDAGSSNGNSNGTVIEAPAGTTAVKLPADAGQKLSHDKLIVKSDALTLEIPAALLTKLTANLSADQLKDSTITLKLQPLSGTDAANIIDKGEQSSNAAITLAGDVFEFSLTLTSADGTTHAMTQFDTPITIRLSVNAGIDPTTAGIYYIADDGKLEYIGGKVDGSEMVAQISHFSKYAVLQLDVKFSDVRSNYWAYNVIRELAAKQIVNGTSAATFEPNRSITRAEFTSLLVNALRLTATGNAAFSDVSPSAWYAKPVSEAYQAGIVQGRSASTFDPNGTITREEMVTMIVKSYKLLTGSQPAVPASAPFKDMAGVAPWAVDYVKAAAALNLVNGRSEGQFVPKGVSTRAESAQMIYNLLEQH